MTVLSLLIFLFWLVCGLDFIRGVGFKIPRLDSRFRGNDKKWPKVSILFAARNEGPRVEAALKSMLSQDYPDYEVIAVNDRSTDDTLAVMKKFGEDTRLKILDMRELPQGWLGKNHALDQGTQISSGSWLLFTDADVIFDPGTLRTVIPYSEEKKIDHMALFPQMVTKGLLEMIFTTCFGIGFFMYFRPWEAANPKSKASLGIGAFNLVRRSAYEKIGGHKNFALNVLDDMELGRQLKRAGFRQAVVFGQDLLSVRWVQGGQGILKSLEKNGFAGVDYSLGFLLAWTVVSILLNVLPFLLIFTSGIHASLSWATVAMIFLVFLAAQRLQPRTLLVFPFYPLGCLLVFAMIWRSAFLALREGGIRWRDTFYGLEELRNAK